MYYTVLDFRDLFTCNSIQGHFLFQQKRITLAVLILLNFTKSNGHHVSSLFLHSNIDDRAQEAAKIS